jgi:D-glycero-D-manno-heptose 1,7-bisphosphate phosphatase
MSRKSIFLDRDGVLVDNSEHYYIWKKEQLAFVDGVFENLKLLSSKGFQLFIVSNQGGIARGLYTQEEIIEFHKELIRTFRDQQIEIAEILFCPHHPEIEKCLCRKPSGLMIEKLIAKYSLNKADCLMIGDSESDIEAAIQAGINAIRIPPNQNMLAYIDAFLNE